MDRLRLVSLLAPMLLTVLTGCRDETSPSPTPEEQFPAGCAAPSNGMEVTCSNVCEKVARCSVGLCAQQTSEALFCAPETFTALHASCMAGCTDAALAADATIHECTLAASCEEAFIDKACTPNVSLACTAPSDTDTDTDTDTESSGSESSSSGYDYTSSTTSYGDDSSSTSYGSSSTGDTEGVTSSGSSSSDASTSDASTSDASMSS